MRASGSAVILRPMEHPSLASALPAPPAPRPLRVAFLCVQNANRSQMAEAWARLLGGGRIEVHSAGTQPGGLVHPKAIAAMAEVGYDLSSHVPKRVRDLPLVRFDAVASMGYRDTAPSIPAVWRETWAIPDPQHLPQEPFRAVRNLIGWRVHDMLLDLGIKPARSVFPFGTKVG